MTKINFVYVTYKYSRSSQMSARNVSLILTNATNRLKRTSRGVLVRVLVTVTQQEMLLILQKCVIAFLPYAFRTSFREGTYGCTLQMSGAPWYMSGRDVLYLCTGRYMIDE